MTVHLSDSDEFTTLAVRHEDGGWTELGPHDDVFTVLRLTDEERLNLIRALLLPGMRLVEGRKRVA